MSDIQENDLQTMPGHWDIVYNYAMGETASRFFRSLRDSATILGTTCDTCKRTMVPPRAYCERCFRPCHEWREVGPEGRVVAFTVSYRPTAGIGRDPPFMIAMIRLDHADSNLIHVVEGCDLSNPQAIVERVRAGLRVRAHYHPREKRVGRILDIDCFRVIA